jgi:hypothetical protein
MPQKVRKVIFLRRLLQPHQAQNQGAKWARLSHHGPALPALSESPLKESSEGLIPNLAENAAAAIHRLFTIRP